MSGRPGPARRSDDGSMPVALLLITVLVGMSVVVANVTSRHQATTRSEVERLHALNAAQTGLEVALGRIRMSTRADGSGNPATLPCTSGSPVTGSATTAGPATYRVLLHYTLTQPASGNVSPANPWTCGSTALGRPAAVVVESRGTSGRSSRTLIATYAFTTVTRNDKIAGGLIRAFSDAGGNYCLSAGPATNLTGTQLLIRTCDAANPRQRFAYEAGLALALASVRAVNGDRLCLDGGTTPAAGNPVLLRVCAADPTPGQTWGYDDASAFYVRPTTSSTTRYCLTASTGDADATVALTARAGPTSCTAGDEWDSDRTFIIEATVGTGRAGESTGQLVNSSQFGRCVDVTADDVTSTYLVIFPCKQPLAGAVLWNQNWVLPTVAAGQVRASGPIHTTTGGRSYCLNSPGNTTRPNYYVTVRQCTPTGAVPAGQVWTVLKDTGLRSTSYRIESPFGVAPGAVSLCLQPTDPGGANPDLWTGATPPAVYNLTTSKLVVATCGAGDLQKWNVISTFHEAALTDLVER